jgi:prepilin-type N-terminal cleavage/methylation domain-containing protein
MVLRQRGFVLIEVMAVAGIFAVMVTVVAAWVAYMQRNREQQLTVTSLATLQSKIYEAALAGTSWQRTVADTNNAEMACLRNNTACVAGNYNFALHDANNAVIYDSHLATNGFSISGAACTSYAAGGNSLCPISYNMYWSPNCAALGALPCINPPINITVNLLYSPGPATRAIINPTVYYIFVSRGSGTRYEPVIVEYAPPAGSLTIGEGTCSTVGWTARQLNTIVRDDGSNIAVNPAGTTVTLRPGTYQCRATAPAYEVGQTKILIWNATTGVGMAMGPGVQAPVGSQIMMLATAEGEFTFNTNTQLQVLQTCGSTNNSFDLGYPVPEKNGTYILNDIVYTILECVRVT